MGDKVGVGFGYYVGSGTVVVLLSCVLGESFSIAIWRDRGVLRRLEYSFGDIVGFGFWLGVGKGLEVD